MSEASRVNASVPLPPREQLTIDYYQRQRGTKRMVDMFFEFTELCTTIPPLEYGGNEVLLDYFASKVKRCVRYQSRKNFCSRDACRLCSTLSPSIRPAVCRNSPHCSMHLSSAGTLFTEGTDPQVVPLTPKARPPKILPMRFSRSSRAK